MKEKGIPEKQLPYERRVIGCDEVQVGKKWGQVLGRGITKHRDTAGRAENKREAFSGNTL